MEGIKIIAKEYPVKLLQHKNGDCDRVITHVSPSTSIQDNEQLIKSFSLEEFREADFSMNNNRCSRPDGFNPGFFKSFWNTCSNDVFPATCLWLETCAFPAKLS